MKLGHMANVEPLRVASDVHWVGVNDLETERFEGLWEIPEGVSLNSYLVIGSKKTALIDSVLKRYESEQVLAEDIRYCNPRKIDA